MLHNTLNSAYFLSLPGIHPMAQGQSALRSCQE